MEGIDFPPPLVPDLVFTQEDPFTHTTSPDFARGEEYKKSASIGYCPKLIQESLGHDAGRGFHPDLR